MTRSLNGQPLAAQGAEGGMAAGAGRWPRACPRASPGAVAEPIRLGFQLHRTGIGAAYGRWYERTARRR
jgi:branched-chain amino acid transport system substrate-binding protein